MNAHTPFDANQDWSNPYCQNKSNDPMVDALLGNAYHVVRTVYCNLGYIKHLYDFLSKYGVVICVQSEAELKTLTTEAKYARIYDKSPAGDQRVTDYLYVEGDRTGVIPDDTTATGSWVSVASSNSGDGSKDGGYIPWVYNSGSANGGETSIRIPDETAGAPFMIVNGDWQTEGYDFEYDPLTFEIKFTTPLEQGDFVVVMRTGVPATPDNPNVSDWVTINWLYNHGAAVGGEQVIDIPYTFQSVPAVYKNGLRFSKGLANNSYTIDSDNNRIILTEPLATNDRLVIQLGGEAKVLETVDRTIQEVARVANVKDSEVILSTDATQVLNGKKVVYSVSEQRAYGLPVLPTNVYIKSVTDGKLTYNPGSVTVDLLDAPSQLRQQLEGASVYDKDFTTIAEAFGRASQNGAALVITSSRTIRVPSEAPSIQAVVNICTRLKQNVYLTVLLDAGFQFTTETLVEKRDCSWITIQSTDPVVPVSSSFSGTNLMHVVNSFGPIWDILADMAGSSAGNGIYVRRNSDIEVRPGKGVINAVNTAVVSLPCGIAIVESSRGHIPSSNFSGNYRNLWVSKSSQCNAEGGNFDNATGDFATYIVRNSLCHLSLATVNNAAHNAVYANNSRITFLEGEAINADTALYAEFAGVIYSRPRDGNITNISGSRINAISASNGGVIIAEGMTISPASGFGITARDGGKVSAVGTSVLATGTALNVYNEGEVNIAGAGNVISSSSTGVNVVRAYQGGRINLDGAVVTGGSNGLIAESGGTIHARGVNMSGQAANTIQATGGYVNADNSVLSKSSVNADIVYARRGGIINANFSTITGGRIGAHADVGGRVCVNNSIINGASTGGVRATGGEVYAQSATIQNNTGKDLAVLSGGALRAGGATTTNSSPAGTPNPSDANAAFNTFASAGFIFA